MTLNPCCVGLANLMSEPGEKGFSVLPVRDAGRHFILQARSVDPAAVEELKKPPGPGRQPIAVAIAMELPLMWCPHGGCFR